MSFSGQLAHHHSSTNICANSLRIRLFIQIYLASSFNNFTVFLWIISASSGLASRYSKACNLLMSSSVFGSFSSKWIFSSFSCSFKFSGVNLNPNLSVISILFSLSAIFLHLFLISFLLARFCGSILSSINLFMSWIHVLSFFAASYNESIFFIWSVITKFHSTS